MFGQQQQQPQISLPLFLILNPSLIKETHFLIY